jgi:hypothetical protein
VQWPDGESSARYRVFANQFVVIDRTEASGRLLVSGPLNAVLREARRHSPESQEFDHPGSPSLQLTSP